MTEKSTKYSFEEFKLMYESAEKVTDRRLSMNKSNYSIATATFVAIAFFVKFTFESLLFVQIGCVVVLIISFLAIVFTKHWLRQVNDYKLLNTAKFRVINNMSENMSFESQSSGFSLESFRPFKSEWDELQILYEK